MSHQVNSKIIAKIYQLVAVGVRSTREMQRFIKFYVKDELFRGSPLSDPTSRRYNSRVKDIRNHIYKASVKLKFSKLDQANLEQQVTL